MPLENRNRLTLTIWWSLLLNLVAIEIKNMVLIFLALSSNDKKVSSLSNYALEAAACLFYTNAIIL